MITAIFYGLVGVLLLRWVIWGTNSLFDQAEDLNQMCSDGLHERHDQARVLSCLLRSGLSE